MLVHVYIIYFISSGGEVSLVELAQHLRVPGEDLLPLQPQLALAGFGQVEKPRFCFLHPLDLQHFKVWPIEGWLLGRHT